MIARGSERVGKGVTGTEKNRHIYANDVDREELEKVGRPSSPAVSLHLR